MAFITPLLHKSIQHLDPVAVFQCGKPGSDPGSGIVMLALRAKAQLAAQSILGSLILNLDRQLLPKECLTAKHLCIMQ